MKEELRDAILDEAIESLRKEGLRFSVDTLSLKMKISKKTVYKFFPTKEALALALYEKYYRGVTDEMQTLLAKKEEESNRRALELYFDTKRMTNHSIFNKYRLNQVVYEDITKKAEALWGVLSSSFSEEKAEEEREALRIILDGAFEKLCEAEKFQEKVIERLMRIIW